MLIICTSSLISSDLPSKLEKVIADIGGDLGLWLMQFLHNLQDLTFCWRYDLSITPKPGSLQYLSFKFSMYTSYYPLSSKNALAKVAIQNRWSNVVSVQRIIHYVHTHTIQMHICFIWCHYQCYLRVLLFNRFREFCSSTNLCFLI